MIHFCTIIIMFFRLAVIPLTEIQGYETYNAGQQQICDADDNKYQKLYCTAIVSKIKQGTKTTSVRRTDRQQDQNSNISVADSKTDILDMCLPTDKQQLYCIYRL